MKATIVIIVLLLMIPIVISQNEQPDTTKVLTEVETKTLIIEEAAKTRADIKEYLERKTIDYNKNTQQMIDKNFQVLDSRLDKMIRDAGFKFGVIIFSGLVLGGSLLLWINRRINKKTILQSKITDERFRENINVSESSHREPTPMNNRTPGRKKTEPPRLTPTVPASPQPQYLKDIEKKTIPSFGDGK